MYLKKGRIRALSTIACLKVRGLSKDYRASSGAGYRYGIVFPLPGKAGVVSGGCSHVFIAIVQVRRWLPITKIWKMVWPQPRNSPKMTPIVGPPTAPPTTWPTPPKESISGYCMQNSPKIRPEYPERIAMTTIRAIPGPIPTLAMTEGSERIPRDTVSAKRIVPAFLFEPVRAPFVL